MTFNRNEFGVLQYPVNDVRRLFVLLSAIDLLERPTISAIADLTGLEPAMIVDDVELLREQFGVEILKVGAAYRIESWGDILKKNGVRKRMRTE